MYKPRPYVILGAGLAGLSAAFFLERDYQLFEQAATAGGLCRSRHIRGYTFDYDGHLLHFKRQSTLKLVKRLLADNLCCIKRDSWINSFGRYTPYPFQANLRGLPPDVIEKCVSGFLRAQANRRSGRARPDNFRQWLLDVFGEGIARYFLLPYNNKFWTVPARRLTCEWVDDFVPVPQVRDLLAGLRAENKKGFGYNVRFWYPKRGGMEELIFALQRRLTGALYTRHQATAIDLSKRIIYFKGGRKAKFADLIFTLPLPQMSRLFSSLPAQVESALGRLKYTSIFCLNLGVARPNLCDKHWIYFPEKKFVFFRVGFPASFSPQLAPARSSSLYAEVAYSPDRPINRQRLVRRIIGDLRKAGILAKDDKIEACSPVDIEYGYIIYDRNYKKSVEAIVRFLRRQRIYPAGRYGRWKYMSMEDVILDGKRLAGRLKAKAARP